MSRADHPRAPGRHKVVHAGRADFKEPGKGDRIEWGTPKARVLATPAYGALAILEGLADLEADLADQARINWEGEQMWLAWESRDMDNEYESLFYIEY